MSKFHNRFPQSEVFLRCDLDISCAAFDGNDLNSETLDQQAIVCDVTAFRFQREGDAATFAWIDQGFGFAVTAPATREELLPIAEAVYRGFGSVSSSK